MAYYSVREAEHQREGVLRLDIEVHDHNITYSAVAVVPLEKPSQITVVSNSRHMPSSEEIEAAVQKYLRENGI